MSIPLYPLRQRATLDESFALIFATKLSTLPLNRFVLNWYIYVPVLADLGGFSKENPL